MADTVEFAVVAHRDVQPCYRHRGYDTDGDGQCGAYATATPEMQAIMLGCVFTPYGLTHEEEE